MAGDLLVVWHPRPPSIAALRDAVLLGFAEAGTDRPVRSLAAPEAGIDDVEAAAATVIVTPENFGMVSGLVKDFLERIYPWFEEVPNRRPGMPYLLIAKGASDGTGAVRDVTRILPPVVVRGSLTDEHRAAAQERAATLAAGVDAGVF